MIQIPDLSDSELWTVKTTLRERYGRDTDIELADSEIRLNVSDRDLTQCPVVYWGAEGCHFVVFKTGDHNYRSQFYYRVHQMFGTGIEEYDDLSECVVTLLQVQADHAAGLAGQ